MIRLWNGLFAEMSGVIATSNQAPLTPCLGRYSPGSSCPFAAINARGSVTDFTSRSRSTPRRCSRGTLASALSTVASVLRGSVPSYWFSTLIAIGHNCVGKEILRNRVEHCRQTSKAQSTTPELSILHARIRTDNEGKPTNNIMHMQTRSSQPRYLLRLIIHIMLSMWASAA